MPVDIQLFGFGSEKPARFGASNRHRVDIATPATPSQVLAAAGIDDGEGLLLMRDDTVIPTEQWRDPIVADGDRLTLMFAIEGG